MLTQRQSSERTAHRVPASGLTQRQSGKRTAHRVPASVLTQRQSGERTAHRVPASVLTQRQSGERTAHRVPASVLTQRQSGEFPVECAERGRSGEATKHSSRITRAGTGEQRTGETRGREGTEEKSNYKP